MNKRNWFAARVLSAGLTALIMAGAAYTGPAFAQLTIDTARTSPVATSEATGSEDVIVESAGSITIDQEGAVITVDSDNNVTVQNGASLKNNSASNATGINIEIPGAGRISNLNFGGDIFLGEADVNLPLGSNNIGIQIGDDGGLGTLTGNVTFESGTIVRVEGNESIGVNISQRVDGNLIFDGSIIVSGSNAQGVVSTAAITGQMTFRSDIFARGTGTPTVTDRDPISGSAIAVGASISELIDHDNNGGTAEILIGGIGINGPVVDFVDRTAPAQIRTTGGAPAVYISPLLAGAAGEDIVLGRYSNFAGLVDLDGDGDVDIDDFALDPNFDPASAGDGVTRVGLFGFVNRGTIQSDGVEPGVDTEGFRIEGDGVHSVTFAGGLYSNGAIIALASSHNLSATNEPLAASDATALIIGSGATVPLFQNDGTVTGQTQGDAGGTAIGILIEEGGTLPSIENNSAINGFSNTIEGTDLENIEAFAILDRSGTLLNIDNTGFITSTATATSFGSTTVAIDVSAATEAVTISNTQRENALSVAAITGDIRFGAAPDNQLIIDGHFTADDGVTTRASVDGRVTAIGGVDVSVVDGTLRTEQASVRNISVGSAGAPNSEVGTIQFLLENAPNPDPIMSVSGAADFYANSTVEFSSLGFLGSDGVYTLLRASQGIDLIGRNLDELITFSSPFLFQSAFEIESDGDIDTLSLALERKTAADLGLTGNRAAVYESALTAASQDDIFGRGLLSITDQVGVDQSLNSLLPNIGAGARALSIAVTDSIAGPIGRRQRSLIATPEQGVRFWGQQFYQDLNGGSTATSPSFFGSGTGVSVGIEWGQTPAVRYGVSYTYFAGQVTQSGSQITKENIALNLASVYASWRSNGFFLTPQANVGYASYDNRRRVVAGPITRSAISDWSSFLTSGGVTSGYVMDLGAFQLIPHVSIDGLYMYDSAYTERLGGNGVNLALTSRTTRSVRLFAGVVAQTEFMLDDGIMKPQILAGWSKDLVNDRPVIDASFEAAPGSDFSVVGPVNDSSRILGAASFSYLFDNWSAAFSYDAAHSSGALSQSASISMTSRF